VVPGAERVRFWWIAAAFALAASTAPVHSVAAQERSARSTETDCGPAHDDQVREILRMRDPGALPDAGPARDVLALDRALIIDDFLRLMAAQRRGARDAGLPNIDEGRLRQQRDSGRTTPEVCAVVRVMHAYYSARTRAESPAPTASAAPAERTAALPSSVASPSTDPLPSTARIESAGVPPSAARPPELSPSLPDVPAAPAAEVAEPEVEEPIVPRKRPAHPLVAFGPPLPPVAPAGSSPAEIEAAQRARNARVDEELRAALPLITEMEDQLRVPRYLSFREARVKTPSVADEEILGRREAALRAMQRVVVLLSMMKDDPQLRRAVQTTLGPQGRARVETALLHSFRSVPDAEERTWALRLWYQLEALARDDR